MKRFTVLFATLTLAAASSVLAQATAQNPPAVQAPAQPQRPPQPPLGPNQWLVDSAHTAAQFSVKHMMVSTVRGTLGRVTGTVEYDGKSIESVKADISIDVKGINTDNEGRDNDLRSAGFFDVATYATVTFKSKRVEPGTGGHFRLVGDLTIHGVTKEVTLDVEGPSAAIKTQNGGLKVGASATTKVNRRDFGLNYNRMIEAGQVVGEDIQITIDIELNKPPSA